MPPSEIVRRFTEFDLMFVGMCNGRLPIDLHTRMDYLSAKESAVTMASVGAKGEALKPKRLFAAPAAEIKDVSAMTPEEQMRYFKRMFS